MLKLTTGEAVAKSLVAHGVDTIFGIPGAHMYDFNDAVAQEPGLTFITNRHEQGAGYMAFGYAKSTGKTGVYTVVPGPGLLNSAAALCTAYGANTPVLCITGNIMSDMIGRGRGQLHELPDQLATMRGFTGWAERINHPTEAPELVNKAMMSMRKGRIFPAALEAPWDVYGQSAVVDMDVDLSIPKPTPVDADQIEAAAKMIANAKNPMIILGAGANEAAPEIQALVEMLQAPVTSHRSGKGIVSNDHPLSLLSTAAFEYWPKCDVLIGIGSRLDLAFMRWCWQPKGLKMVRIDIDPTEMVRLKPDLPVVADARLATIALMDSLSTKLGKVASREDECAGYKAKAHKRFETLKPQTPYIRAMREALPRDGFYVEEISQMGFTARFSLPVYAPRQFVTCGYQDNLGFGYHTGLGVKVGNPDKCVLSVSGDGGFMFGVQELATAVQFRINLVTVIFNNNAFGNVRRDQMTKYDGRLIGADLVNPDFVKLAESFGAKGVRVTTPEALKIAITEGFSEDGPVIIEVPVETGSETTPWTFVHPTVPE